MSRATHLAGAGPGRRQREDAGAGADIGHPPAVQIETADELREIFAGLEHARMKHRRRHDEAEARRKGLGGFPALQHEMVRQKMDDAADQALRQAFRGGAGARRGGGAAGASVASGLSMRDIGLPRRSIHSYHAQLPDKIDRLAVSPARNFGVAFRWAGRMGRQRNRRRGQMGPQAAQRQDHQRDDAVREGRRDRRAHDA